jgi:SAM-dependent methyltransferase
VRKIPDSFKTQYQMVLEYVAKENSRFKVFEKYFSQVGEHPVSYIDHECAFAAKNVAKFNPSNVLDIGSYRHFILGMLAYKQVSTIDIRRREPATQNEIVITSDAKELNIQDASFDAIVTLCSLEHFGLGRYGDEFDLDADKKAVKEMIRVLKPGGILIFTTAITRAQPSIAFNGLRIYDYEMITEFCNGLTVVDECFISNKLGACSLEQITDLPIGWDVYCGCWKK